MISIAVDSFRFNYRAAAIVVEDDHLLLHRLMGENFWSLPGGRVNAGESAESALRREFNEELETSIDDLTLACVGENFFHYDGERFHEVCLYSHAYLPMGSPLSNKNQAHLGVEEGHHLEFKWFSLNAVHQLDLRPQSVKQGLREGSLPPHFVEREASTSFA